MRNQSPILYCAILFWGYELSILFQKLLVPTNLLMSDIRVTGFQKYNKTEQIILDTEENVSENKESMPEVEIDISEIDESIPEVEMRMPETMRI